MFFVNTRIDADGTWTVEVSRSSLRTDASCETASGHKTLYSARNSATVRFNRFALPGDRLVLGRVVKVAPSAG